MEVQILIQEIQRLPLLKRFFVMEETLKSIKKEELKLHSEDNTITNNKNFSDDIQLTAKPYLVSEKSLAKDWLSEEDNRWDEIL